MLIIMKANLCKCVEILFILCCTAWKIQATQTCAFFQFPNLTNRTLTAKEYTLANFTFHVIDNACLSEVRYIQIRKNMSRQCEIETTSVSCGVYPLNSFCYCVLNSRSFRFMKILHRSDKVQWKWTATGKGSKTLAEDNIIFDITYQANVTCLDIIATNGSRLAPVQFDNRVEIICSWENGNPPTVVRLLSTNGSVLMTSNKSGNITYFIEHVHCEDAGTIKCEADGSATNASAQLLVVCPPSFDKSSFKHFNVDYGKIWEMSFRIRAHTSYITNCYLRQYFTEMGIAGYQIFQCTIHNNGKTPDFNSDSAAVPLFMKCACRTSGTAPDLTLTVRLYNTTEKDSGRWQLTLANYKGSSDMDFWIKINKGLPKLALIKDKIVTATEGSKVYVMFSIFTHSSDFIMCQLSKYKDHTGGAVHDAIATYKCSFQVMRTASGKLHEIQYEITSEKCFCYVNGTIPDMMVQVVLYGINEQDKGHWRLTLANEVGSGEADFELQILKEETEIEKKNDPSILITIITCSVALAIISAAFIAFFFIKRGGTVYDRPKQAAPQDIVSYRIISHPEETNPNAATTHEATSVYDEINHNFTIIRPKCETKSNTRCSSNENQQEDYVEAISDETVKECPSTPSSSTSSDSTSSRRRGYLHAVDEISGTPQGDFDASQKACNVPSDNQC